MPTQVLSVEGEEVLRWGYCVSGQLTRDLGILGIGVDAVNPPVVVLQPDDHIFTLAQVVAWYSGGNTAFVQLLTDFIGPELTGSQRP